MKFKIENLQQLQAFADAFANSIEPNCVIGLQGDLGTGKTAFTKCLAKSLNVNAVVNSPTFTIVKQYQGDYALNHFDVYRLENQTYDLGFEEMLEYDVNVIEWFQFIEPILPKERFEIEITLDNTTRIFNVIPKGERYERMLKKLCTLYC